MSRRFWIASLPICAAGTFIFFAGGVQWGTADCGFLSFFTLAVALIAGCISAVALDRG